MKTAAITLEVAAEDAGRTLPAVLHDRAGYTHAEARGLIDAGAVRGPLQPGRDPDGAPAIAPYAYAHRVTAGERYRVRPEPGRRYRPKPPLGEGKGYRVVHADPQILVVEKQPRLLTVPTSLREEDSLIELLLEGERRRGVRRPSLYALHRLDRDTSGLLLFARNRRAFEMLQEQFATRAVERVYLAVAEGWLKENKGTFKSRLIEDRKSLKMHSTRRQHAGKEAITEYEVSERLPSATVLTVRLRTGRKNQIRVHLAEAGHPLIGDHRYGKPSRLIGRTALHARSLGFTHPGTGRKIAFTSDPPRDLRHLIKTLRRDDPGRGSERRDDGRRERRDDKPERPRTDPEEG